jgi:hypothetical protein
MEPNVIDVAPLADVVLQYFVIGLGALASVGVAWLANLLKKKFNLDIEARHREALTGALEGAVAYGARKANALYADKTKIETKNAALALAANYAVRAVPDALKAFKIDPTSPEGQARVLDLVESRLEDWLIDGSPEEERTIEVVNPTPPQVVTTEPTT